MRVFMTILFLSSFCFSGLLNAEETSPWQLRENQQGIAVSTRKVAGSPILEYKANIIVDAPLPKVIALFEDTKLITLWYYQCVHSELVETDGPDKKIVYLILHLPWPVTARDIVFSITKSQDPTSGIISYSLMALPDRLPHVKGMIRVPSIKALWNFKSLPQGQTAIFFQQFADPGGSLPAFLVNEISVDTPFYSLKNFRKLISGKNA